MTEPDAPETAQPTRTRRSLAHNGLHLFALSGLAFAQPLFNLLEGDPSSLIIDGAAGFALVLLALMLLLVPPALLLALEALASLAGERALRAVHLVFVGALIALFVFQARTSMSALPDSTFALTVVALAIAAGGTFAYARSGGVRSFVGLLAFAPLVFAALFLFSGPASPLLTVADPPIAEAAEIPSDAPPVVFIVFDELPLMSLMDEQRRIDAVRYPNFARLAGDGTWFRNTTSVDAGTPWAVPAIMDGDRPRRGVISAAGYHPHSIFALLGSSYAMHVREVVTRICPRRLCPRDDPKGLAGAWRAFGALNAVMWDRLLPETYSREAAKATAGIRGTLGANDPDTINDRRIAGLREFIVAVTSRHPTFEKWVAGIRAASRPTLHFIHALYPHEPWEHLPSGRKFNDSEPDKQGTGSRSWVDSQTRVDTLWQAHLLQLQYTDHLLGTVLDKLEAEGIYDKAVIAVTADHGETYRAGHLIRYPTRETLSTLAPVPFIIKRPGEKSGRIDDRPVLTIDVMPTIADTLGVKLPWKADGMSAFGAPRPEAEPVRMTKYGKDPKTISRAALLQEEAAVVRERISLSGTGRDDRRLFAARGFGDLVGLKAPDGPSDDPDVTAKLATPGAWRDVDLDAPGFIPAFVAAKVSGPGPAGRVVAVAVNGRVAAVARTWEADGAERISAIVSDEVLHEGANAVDLLLLRPGRHDLRGATRIGGT